VRVPGGEEGKEGKKGQGGSGSAAKGVRRMHVDWVLGACLLSHVTDEAYD